MKISIFTMNGGNGTMSASLALARYLKNRRIECSVTDFMKETNPLGNILAETYNSLLRKDLRLASFYMEIAHLFPFDKFEPANSLSRKRILRLLEREDPDGIVLICPWIIRPLLKALGYWKKRKPRVYTVIVDLGKGMTSSWVNPESDFTSLPTQQAKRYLKQFGLSDNSSAVLGMPLTPEIQTPSSTPDFLTDLETPLCTVLAGREGGRNSLKIVDLLLKNRLNATVLIQCGLNKALHHAASQRKGVKVIGFPKSVIPLFRASSVLITKPGAMTISELVALKKPFILDTWPAIMPQERGNVEFVQEENCGLVARSLAEIPSMTAEVLSEPFNFAYPNIYGTERIGQLIIKNTI